MSRVRVRSGDTDFGIDLGAYSSRTTLMTGHATKEAGENLKAMILEVLGPGAGHWTESALDIKQGLVKISGDPVDFSAIPHRLHQGAPGAGRRPARGRGAHLPRGRPPGLTCGGGTLVATGKVQAPGAGRQVQGRGGGAPARPTAARLRWPR